MITRCLRDGTETFGPLGTTAPTEFQFSRFGSGRPLGPLRPVPPILNSASGKFGFALCAGILTEVASTFIESGLPGLSTYVHQGLRPP